MTRAPCKNRLEARGDRAHHPQNFGDALSADHEVVSDVNEARVQHHYAFVVKILHLFGFKATLRRTKTARAAMNSLHSSCRQIKTPKYY